MNEKEEEKEEKRTSESKHIPPSHSLVRVYDDEKEGKKDQSSREKERSRTRRAKRERTEK